MSYNNFVFYKEWLDQFKVIAAGGTAEDMASLCDGLKSFLNDEEPENVTPLAQLVLNQMTAQIARDKGHYDDLSEKRSEIGKKGAEARWGKAKDGNAMANDSKVCQTIANDGLKEEVEEEDDVSPNGDKDISSALTIIDGLPEPVPAETNPKKLTDRMLTEEFDVLWKDYPRKVGKHDALRHYKSARKSGITFETIQNGLWNYANYSRGQPEKYIMNGSTWFCGHHWEDKRDRLVNDFERILAL